MEQNEIEAFMAVAEVLHFGQASERLGLSTSRVSHLIRRFERRLGVELFERTSRRVRLTSQGERLLGELKPAYARINSVFAELRQSAGLGSVILRAGFATTLPNDVVTEFVDAVEQRRPGWKVVRSSHPAADVFAWAGDQGWPVDVFVTWMPADTAAVPDDDFWVGPVIMNVPRAVAVAADDPLATRSVIQIEELVDHEVFAPKLPVWYSDEWVPPVLPCGREMRRVRLGTNFVEEILYVVAKRGMVHMTVVSMLDSIRAPGVVVIPLTGLPPLALRAVARAGSSDEKPRTFAEIMADHGRSAGWLAGPPGFAPSRS